MSENSRQTVVQVSGHAKLFIVLVDVLYTNPACDPSEFSMNWTVRIVAANSESAQIGAMSWAERQHAPGFREGSKAFARSATTIDIVGSVDCIGESLRGGVSLTSRR